jgi:hypothetical protein
VIDILKDIIAYEQGELEESQIIALFQQLIDNGMAWSLQGRYGRTATALIQAGRCTEKKCLPELNSEEKNSDNANS